MTVLNLKSYNNITNVIIIDIYIYLSKCEMHII